MVIVSSTKRLCDSEPQRSPLAVLPSLLGTCGLEQISATYMNKSFIIIIIIFLRESVTYSFTCMYREVFLNIYFKG